MVKSRKHIVGNWKMHLGVRESVALARGVLRATRGKEHVPEITICPSFTALAEVNKVLARSRVNMGAQNCATARQGAFTGEVSVPMLEDVGVQYVLVGHSERRDIFGETQDMIREKMQLAMNAKVRPILCVGEPEDVRESGEAQDYVAQQLASAFKDLSIPQKQSVLVAYEPIWAIGSGEPATVGDVVKMHAFVRETVAKHTGRQLEDISVLYGGSVDDENAYSFLRETEVDGLLVGGASIKLQQFSAIIEAGVEVLTAQA